MADDFAFSAGVFPNSTTRPRTLKAVRGYVQRADPKRWARMQKDYAWLRTMAASVEMNPEDARFLL